MNGQVVATIENDRGAIGAIKLGHGLAPYDTARVARNRDDVLEDDILGQQVEEVLTVHQPGYAFLDDPKERVQGLEVVEVTDRVLHSGGLAAFCPPLEEVNLCFGPRAVARHGAGLELGEDCGCVFADVIVRPEIEVGLHRLAVSLAEQGLDVGFEAHGLVGIGGHGYSFQICDSHRCD
jgi:hypothetical protein